ncbi:uncharacterized protein MONOS_1495 [Monocercomonoides exilis]|uniref:uncharacterized protein n=1 Tax=Monocercomonoides exilis TaxID=2049356 RepID=UPI00355A33A8|nr:hypothetical protein MONOS_1495 [Monocercomonoides exilis]|eukprot:MONOS_1495.1-p1 / transcript=MONOS_1495.1 / gene=MONOS_1495 / organism=Monocercomonoides_exilis_PA203 / gene_product=unspecified product / transcript_product=unspecified product / location=Mono_scaffold00026:169043-169510(-) / protein_length=156 / sequence_SO=supercontig / SO=protein_coding / is_pseudo=false
MQIAPPLEIPSEMESLSPVVLDPFHSHQVNVFASLPVMFCLPGLNGTSAVPLILTFLVLLYSINEVFDAVKDAKGLLIEGTIPPSYTSQTDENEQSLIKVFDPHRKEEKTNLCVGAVEILEKNKLVSETLSTFEEDRNGGEEVWNEENPDEKIET